MSSGRLVAVAVALLVLPIALAADRKAAIDPLVQPAIDTKAAPGIVVGVLEGGKTQVFGYGKASDADSRVLDAATVFEIGSITKTFTATALAEMVQRKMVALEDPVHKYLPPDAVPPATNPDTEIRLIDLATQTSGLPSLPSNFKPKDQDNPYADYTPQLLYEYLAKQTLQRKANQAYLYSNLGMGLLGHALSLRYGKSYEQMIADLVTSPLELKDTRITLTADEQARLAQGHDLDGKPVRTWDLPTLAGAGALRSTATDLLRYLDANLNPPEKLKAAIELTHVERAKVGAIQSIALAWHIKADGKTYWHNGGTGGYTSYVSFNVERKTGVVVLVNSGGTLMNLIGDGLEKLLGGEAVAPLTLHHPVSIDPKILDDYLAVYEVAPGVKLTATRDGDQLFLQISGQRSVHAYPEAKDQFFIRVVDAFVKFNRNDQGQVSECVLHQGGRESTWKRVAQ